MDGPKDVENIEDATNHINAGEFTPESELTPVMQRAAYDYGAEAADADLVNAADKADGLTSGNEHYAKGSYSIPFNNLAGEKTFSKNTKKVLSDEYNKFSEKMGKIDTVRGVQNHRYLNNSVWGSYNDNSGTITMFNAGGDDGIAFMSKLAKQMKKEGKWSTSSPFHAYRHELGHAWLAYLKKTDANYNYKISKIEIVKQQILDGLTNLSENDKLTTKANILSEYGLTEGTEIDDFICECVAEYINGKPKYTARTVIDILMRKE